MSTNIVFFGGPKHGEAVYMHDLSPVLYVMTVNPDNFKMIMENDNPCATVNWDYQKIVYVKTGYYDHKGLMIYAMEAT